MVCFGANESGQCEVPSTLGECIAIAAGASHTMAITLTGATVCWGSNEYGQCMPPQNLTVSTAIACGWHHSLAVDGVGVVAAWGRNDLGQIQVPPLLPPSLAVAGGASHSLALQSNGIVHAWGANGSGQSTVPPLLGACTQIAAGGFHSVALRADGSVAAWGKNVRSASVVGSSRASEFLRDAMSAVDSVDVLLAGDSNTGFGTSADGSSVEGWTDGIAIALSACGIHSFATPLLPVSTNGSALGVGSFQWPMTVGTGSTGGAETAHLIGGFAAAPIELAILLAPSPEPLLSGLHTTGSPFDFGWVPRQSYPFYSDGAGIYITPESPLDVTSELTYRVLRTALVESHQPGSYFQGWTTAAGQTLVPRTERSALAAQSGWVTDELVLPADPSRGAATVHADCGGNFLLGLGGIEGNIGLGLHSVYRHVRGFACQPLEFHGGATMTTIARDVAKMPLSSRKTWLSELRARQIAAGGTGRVIVFIQGGINQDAGLPESWGTAVLSVQSALTEAWNAIGAPPDDIAFLAMVSHPVTSNDFELSAVRAYANGLPSSHPNLAIIDLSKLTSADELAQRNWYAESTKHLSSSGYSQLAQRVIGDLLEHSGACDVPASCLLPGASNAIAAGEAHTVSLMSGGSVIAWGSPRNGQCDVAAGQSSFAGIAAGSNHTLALVDIGTISAWGASLSGACDAPALLRDVHLVAAGAFHSVASGAPLPPCVGDTNFDWVIDSADLTAALSGWGFPGRGDVTHDGTTDGHDMAAIFSAWGVCR